MPLYEYECRSCTAVTDIRHGFDDTNQEPCPSCGGELVRRFNAAGIVFKGSGFYVTDSRKSSGSSESSGSSSSPNSSPTPSPTPASTPSASTSSPAA